ncbi:MAG: TraR/DksA C4-type zinc finger protein [Actinomycetota bacterium]|nr:TraR/DksA C4-type zinc finger protein [Actinomycetota bacterium]
MSTDATIQGLRTTLEDERESLRSQLAELGYGAQLDYDPNFADSSQVTAERGETEALVQKLVTSLHEVEHALEKFGSEQYGLCEACGQRIADARLEARPEARLCMACAAKSH